MSLWSHRELRVVVGPEQVALLPVRRRLGVRGLRRTIDEPHVVSCNCTSGVPPWRAALHALETVLHGYDNGKASATVILSNRFMRYTMVPWRAELADAEEELLFTRHCFTQVYGKAAQQWELRLSHGAPEAPRLASAMDTELLDALQGVFHTVGIDLFSIQPHLMTAFNGFRGSMQQRSAWIALFEPGNLCLALLHQARWQRVRSLRIAHDWREDLLHTLEREAYLADRTDVSNDVYMLGVEPDAPSLAEAGPWQFHVLPPGQDPVYVPAQDRQSAMPRQG